MNIESYTILLRSFKKKFSMQSRILIKEIQTIKYATNYYRHHDSFYSSESIKDLSQEYLELEIIYDGIRNIEKKAFELKKQFTKKGDFDKLIHNIYNRIDNSHITIIPIIDSKINQFSELFDELNFYKQSYFNLVDSKEFSYIPSPKFNKRFRNANLGLYLNKQLNDKNPQSYRSLLSKFYEDNKLATNKSIEKFNKTNFFATWSYSTEHYIKNFNSPSNTNKEQKNIYISMSYTYLDKTLFQPIAYHEISHAMEHIKLPYSDKKNLEESIFTFGYIKDFKKNNPLDDLYKEILCDLSAVYATGYSYILSLIHVGFFELKELFFQFDELDTSEDVKDVYELLKIKPNQDISPKNFDFNINNIYLSVRMLILIELCNKLGIKNTYIDGIKCMLNIVFPEPTKNTNEHQGLEQSTFLNMYEFISTNAPAYNQSRFLIYSLFEKLKVIILKKSLITFFEDKSESEIFSKFKHELSSRNTHIDNLLKSNKLLSHSIYDLLWLYREKPIQNNKKEKTITERDINRLYNIYNLYYQKYNFIENTTGISYIKYNSFENIIRKTFINIFNGFFNKSSTLFYNLEFIKYKSTKGFHPFIEFLKPKKIENNKFHMHYIFAPYDIALLKEVLYSSNISEQLYDYPYRYHPTEDKLFEDKHFRERLQKIKWVAKNKKINGVYKYIFFKKYKNSYFIDRHSLFLLESFPNTALPININPEEKGRAYSIITQVKLNNTFSSNGNISFLNFMIKYIKENNIFTKCRIFKSLGGEDYIIYVEGLFINDCKRFGKYIKAKYSDFDIEIEDLILLSNPVLDDNEIEANDFQVVSFSKINHKLQKTRNFYNDDNDYNPPKDSYTSIKIPTNRFDCIIDWKENGNTLKNIETYLKKTFYTIEGDDSYFSDFNIEIMHTKKTDTMSLSEKIIELEKENEILKGLPPKTL